MESLSFIVNGALVATMALIVVSARNPLRSALALIVALAAQAGLYMQLDAPFVAAMQVLVYAGAIMVLFVFVIMLLNAGKEPFAASIVKAPLRLLGMGSVLMMTLTSIAATSKSVWPVRDVDGSVACVGRILLTDYVFAFEGVSVVLLVAVLGAIVLGSKRLS